MMSRRAVVFGSNGPPNAGALHYAAKDAMRVADTLRQPRCGFEVISPPNTVDPSAIEKCVREVAENSREGDTLAIFFSGHGFIEGSNLWLMLDSTDARKPMTTALDTETLVKSLKLSPATHKILILDCCHAGMAFSDSRFKDSLDAPVEQFVAPPEEESSSFVAIVASDRLEQAREIDALQASFFSHTVCDALGDSFESADDDQDGAIDLTDLKKWLTVTAQQYNEDITNARVPVPYVFGRERGRLYLTRDPSDWTIFEVESFSQEYVLLPYRASDDTAWLIGKTPVTNAQYRRFVNYYRAGEEPIGERFVRDGPRSRWEGPFLPWDTPEFSGPDKPVVCVDFKDAREFATWLASQAGGKLGPGCDYVLEPRLVPTDVWDFAAFGTYIPSFDRRVWGRAKVHDKSGCPAIVSGALQRANRFGAVDLFGNVWEWTDIRSVIRMERCVAPGFQPEIGSITIDDGVRWVERNQEIRGGSFLDNLQTITPKVTVAALKDGLKTKHSDLGFRLAAEIPMGGLPKDIRLRLAGAPSSRGRSWADRVPPTA